jgi:hypothetical protein
MDWERFPEAARATATKAASTTKALKCWLNSSHARGKSPYFTP